VQLSANTRKTIGYALIGLGVLFFLWSATAYCFSSKRWLLVGDATYAYLLNGLNVATGHGVYHTDHPGTTVQILCALFVRIYYFFAPDAGTNGLVVSVLTHPEWYLKNVFIGFFVVQAAILAVVAAWVWASFKNIALLLAVLVSPFISPQLLMIQSEELWPESLIPAMCLLLVLVTLMRWRETTLAQPYPSRLLALGAGVVTGLAFFTKITCLPIFFMSFFFWKDKKSWLYYLLGFASIVLVCVPLLWGQLDRTVFWLVNLATHEGHYGTGPEGLVSAGIFRANMRRMFSFNMPFAVLLVVNLAGLVVLRKKRRSLGWKISLLYMFSVVVSLLLIGKHYRSHYVMPLYFLLFFIPVVYFALAENVYKKTAAYVVCLIFLVSSCYALYTTATTTAREVFTGKFANYDLPVLQGKTIVESFNTFTISHGLAQGNHYVAGRYGDILRALYPNIYTYNIWANQFHHFEQLLPFSVIASGRPVIIRGDRLTTNNPEHSNFTSRLILGRQLASFPEGDRVFELLDVQK